MAKITTSITLTNSFFKQADALPEAVDEVIDYTITTIGQQYRANCRKDTGAQMESEYEVKTSGESGYAAATSAAQDRNPKAKMLEEIKPDKPHQGVVAVAALYAEINERGGDGRTADGVLTQAVEDHRQPFLENTIRAIYGRK